MQIREEQLPGGNYPETWHIARNFLQVLGEVPISFSTPVRTLQFDQRNTGTLSTAGHFLSTRLLRSTTLKSIFYHGTITFFGDQLANSAYVSSSDLVRMYEPRDLSAILGVIYFYRRAQSKRTTELYGWDDLVRRLIIRSEIAGHLGRAIPELGLCSSMLAATMRDLGMLVFGLNDPEHYNEYRQHLESAALPYHYEFELEKWGCTHLDVGANMLQLLGFGINLSHALLIGMGPRAPVSPGENLEAFRLSLAETWLEALLERGNEPRQTHLGQFYPTEKDKYKLMYEVNQLREQGSKHTWLIRSKSDINPRTTPQLYQELLMELEQSSAIVDFYQKNLPKDVLEELSPQDLLELSNRKSGDPA